MCLAASGAIFRLLAGLVIERTLSDRFIIGRWMRYIRTWGLGHCYRASICIDFRAGRAVRALTILQV